MKKNMLKFLVVITILVSVFPALALAGKKVNQCTPKSNQVIVRFTYGSEKQDWIYDVTEAFNQSGIKTASGKTVCVNAIAKGSGDSVKEIMYGQAGPDEVHATSPASDLYVNYINQKYKEQTGKELLKIQDFLVNSPVVIAAWERTIDQFGTNGNIGWKDLFEKAISDRDFRYGQTSPLKSNSGLSALVAQYFAGASKVSGKQVKRLAKRYASDDKVQTFVKTLHESVFQYGDSTGFYARTMRTKGPSFADAVVLYESDVIATNLYIQKKGLNYGRLVAIYPQDGTMVSNHPFAIVKRDWVDADEEEGAQKYFEYLRTGEVQGTAPNYGFRPAIPLELDQPHVKKIVDHIWSEKHGVKPYNTVHNFLIAPNGAIIAKIHDNFAAVKKSAHLYVVFDVSGSMNKPHYDEELQQSRRRLDVAKDALDKQLMRFMTDKDKLSLYLYSSEMFPSKLTKKRPITLDDRGKSALSNYLFPSNGQDGEVTPYGATYMLDAISTVYESMSRDTKKNPESKVIRLMVVLTDGKESSKDAKTRVKKIAKKIGFTNGVQASDPNCKFPVFGIAFGSNADDTYLKHLSERTGGETAIAEKSLRRVFGNIKDAAGGGVTVQ
jgi:Ca-activated chloride channel family protein